MLKAIDPISTRPHSRALRDKEHTYIIRRPNPNTGAWEYLDAQNGWSFRLSDARTYTYRSHAENAALKRGASVMLAIDNFLL